MFRLYWTEAVLRTALLALGMSALTACGTLPAPAVGAPTGAIPAIPATGATGATDRRAATVDAAPPELQQRYAALLARLRAGDATAPADLGKFSAAHPELAGPLLNLGLLSARAGDEAGARALFERATRVCSHCGSPWNELGVLDRRQGRFAEAEQAYRRAIDLEPEYAPPYYNLAVLYEIYVPRPELALENYERYLQVGGDAGEGRAVEKWAADLRRRVATMPKSARAEGTS